MKQQCINCGDEITEGRLKALPNTKTCISCSNMGRKKAILITGGEGDHTWNDIKIVTFEEYEHHQAAEKELDNFLKDENNA